MKKRTKIILTSTLTVTGLILAAGGYWAYKTFVPQETPIDKNATVRTNYYQAINKNGWKRQRFLAISRLTVCFMN